MIKHAINYALIIGSLNALYGMEGINHNNIITDIERVKCWNVILADGRKIYHLDPTENPQEHESNYPQLVVLATNLLKKFPPIQNIPFACFGEEGDKIKDAFHLAKSVKEHPNFDYELSKIFSSTFEFLNKVD